MVSNFCGDCENPVSGNFCGYCGNTVRATKNDRNMTEQGAGINRDIVIERVPDRSFRTWLQLMLLMPSFGQVTYTTAVMKDFKDYLWTRLQADSKIELGSKEVKARSPTFYVMILLMPCIVLAPYLLLLNLSISYVMELVGDDVDSFSDIDTGVLIILFLLFVIVPIIGVLISLIASAFYIYHKHIILSQFIELRYGLNIYNSEHSGVNPSIFRVKQKSLIYFGIASASVISSLIVFVMLITAFSYLATLIAIVIATPIWVTSIIIWLFYEKMWHETMYGLIRFETFMNGNHPRPA